MTRSKNPIILDRGYRSAANGLKIYQGMAWRSKVPPTFVTSSRFFLGNHLRDSSSMSDFFDFCSGSWYEGCCLCRDIEADDGQEEMICRPRSFKCSSGHHEMERRRKKERRRRKGYKKSHFRRSSQHQRHSQTHNLSNIEIHKLSI